MVLKRQSSNWLFVLFFPSLAFAAETPFGDLIERDPGTTENLVNAADTNQQIFDELNCDGNRVCSDDEQALYDDIEKLVDTAFGGESNLNTGTDGLRASLYWFNMEEAAAHGKVSESLSRAQIGSVKARLDTLLGVNTVGMLAHAGTLGGAAGDELTRNWGLFINGDFQTIEKDQTEFTDAQDGDASQVSAGFDFRLSPAWVVGLAYGVSSASTDLEREDQDADSEFEPNVAEGKTDADASTITLYTGYDSEHFFLSAFASRTESDFEFRRLIAYQSNNSNVDGANDIAYGETTSEQTVLGLTGGLLFRQGAWSETLTLGFQSSTLDIDGYEETGDTPLTYAVDAQSIDSNVLHGGLKLSRALPWSSGVAVPYVAADFYKELEDEQYLITANYSAFEGDNQIQVLTDKTDTSYAFARIGLSAVFRSGIQGFVQFSSLAGLADTNANIISTGIRLEL